MVRKFWLIVISVLILSVAICVGFGLVPTPFVQTAPSPSPIVAVSPSVAPTVFVPSETVEPTVAP